LFDPISTFFSILTIVFLIAFALYLARKRSLLSFCILFFFINHVIESSIFPLEIAYEHRNYIPSMIFFLPFAIGLLALIERYEAKIVMKYILAAFIVLLLIGFGHATYLRNFDWKTPETLWSDALQKSPDLGRPHHNLGRYYQQHGHLEEALRLYEKSLEKPPANRKDENFPTYHNLGILSIGRGDYDEAEWFFLQAISINSSFFPVIHDLASVYERQGKYDLAHECLMKSYQMDPSNPHANHNLGIHYLRERNPEQAIHHLSRSLSSGKFTSRDLLYLGIAYKQAGLLGRAAVLFHKAREENPRNIKIYLHLAEVYYKAGHSKRAEIESRKAVEMINSKETFEMILDHMPGTDQNRNIQPDWSMLIPLLEKAFGEKATALHEWSELLQEAEGHTIRKNGH
jgi:protein O-mannosyl-transferase